MMMVVAQMMLIVIIYICCLSYDFRCDGQTADVADTVSVAMEKYQQKKNNLQLLEKSLLL